MTRYILLLPASIALTLLAYVLAPVLPLFARLENGWVNNAEKQAVEPRLPWWLSYFGTPDNSLLGDDGHKERWAGKSRYWQMAAWIRRNPAYTFEWSVLAVEPKGQMQVEGNPNIKNRTDAVAGTLKVKFDNCWMRKSIKPIFGDTALMTEFGWRLQPWAQGRGDGKAQYVFSIRFAAFYPKT